MASLTLEQIDRMKQKGLTDQKIISLARAKKMSLPAGYSASAFENDFGVEARGGSDKRFRDVFGNILPSLGRAAKDIGSAIASPIDTAKGVSQAIGGGLTKLSRKGVLPGKKLLEGREETQSEQAATAVADFFKERYGSPEKAKQTFINDPTGFLLDFSAALTGGGTAVTKAGQVSRIGKLTRAGEVASKVGQAVDPISGAGKLVGITGKATKPVTGLVGRGARFVAEEALGLSTGAGGEAIRTALRNPSPEFTKALRGKTDANSIVIDATNALQNLKTKRGDRYVSQLKKIKDANTKSLDISALGKQLAKRLDDFGVKQTPDGFDFSRSTIDPTEVPRIEAIVDTIKDWGSQKGDRTAVGLDLLKRRLDDFYAPGSRQANAFVQPLKNSVREILNKQVPGYSKMVSDYEKVSSVIKDIQQGLSITDKASVDTTFKKLTSALKENQQFRGDLVRLLEKEGKSSLVSQIAGQQLSSVFPRGLQRYAAQLAGLGGVVSGMGSLFLLLPLSSPRVVGEMLRSLNLGAAKVRRLKAAIEKIKLDPVALDALKNLGEITNELDL